MLADILKQVERLKAGLIDPTEGERKRPITEHLAEFRRYKENRDISDKQTTEVLHRVGGHLDLYVGDFSTAGGKAMGRARDLLRQVRSELSDARNHLAIDSESSPMTAVEPVGV